MKYLFVLCFLFSSLAFAQTEGGYEPLPEVTPAEEMAAERLTQTLGRIHIGMSKDSLQQALPHYHQTAYAKDGNQEWITFSGWMDDDKVESITFYLKNDKVAGWKENKK